MPQLFHILTAHIVFSTQHRRPLLQDTAGLRVWAYLTGILQNLGCAEVTVGSAADHVHVRCNLSKQHPTAVLMEELKRDSSNGLSGSFRT